MADDGAKRTDGGILAPPNPLLHNAQDSKPETARISPEDCYDPRDYIFNSNLLHWETVLLGDKIKSAPTAATGGKPAARAANISDVAPKAEKAVLPTARPEVKSPAKRPAESAKRPVEPAKHPAESAKRPVESVTQQVTSAAPLTATASQPELNRSVSKVERAPVAERAKPAAKAGVKLAEKPTLSFGNELETAQEMAEIAPTSDLSGRAAEASKPSFDVGHDGGAKKKGGLFGRLFGGANKAAIGAADASAAAKAADTALAETAKAAGAATAEATKAAVEIVAATEGKPAPTATVEKTVRETTSEPAPATAAEKPSFMKRGKGDRTTTSTVTVEKTVRETTPEPAPATAAEKPSFMKRGKGDRAATSTATAEKTGSETTSEPATATAAEKPSFMKRGKSDRSATTTASTATMEKLVNQDWNDTTYTKTVTSGAMKSASPRHAKPAKKAADRPLSASNPLYRYFYFTGIQLIRRMRKRRKWAAGFVGEERQRFLENRAKHRRSVKAARHVRKMELHIPFADLREKYKVFETDLKNARQYGSMGATLKVFTQMSGFVLKSIWRVLSVVLNYAAPITACILVALYVSRESSVTMALKVEYNGVDIGYIADESVFTTAANDMKSRMIIGDVYVADPTDDKAKVTYAEMQSAEQLAKANSLIMPRYTLLPVNPNEILTADELTNSLIKAAGKSDGNPDGFAIEEADGLYIDNYYIGAVTDGQGLLDTMSSMLDEYVADIEETEGPIKAQFVKKVQVKRGLYPTNSIRPLGEIQSLLGQESSGTKQYTVVSGDTPLRIAAKNGISFEELKILNPEVETNLQPGDTLLIAKSAPYLGVKISRTIKYQENVKYNIIQKIDKDRAVGYSATTQKGSEGINEITAEVVMIDGIEVERNIIGLPRVVEPAVDQIVVVGGTRKVPVIPSDSSGQVSGGAFAWPAPVHNIGTGFLGYYGHTGADIVWSGCYGSPIFASAGGVVVASGWGGSYGNRIIIDHGGGVQTLYAHCSELYVGVGTVVSQGQNIAAIGRTGNVTGPHLHFEIRINGTPVNPARYLY